MFSFYHADVGVQAEYSCEADQVTIRDPVTASVQCQGCLKCPSGEGLSVLCGEVITPTTPVQCKPCVLGETYSAAYEAGACKDCENCGEYRETTKACTLTSRAECGKCKPGAYAEGMLGQCKPCSPCCNDGKDVIEPECQAQGMPPSMQCSFLRSKKCSALVVKAHASISTTPPTLQPKQSTLPWATSPSVTSSKVNSPSSEPFAHLADDPSPPLGIITGSVVGGLFVIIFPLVVTIRYFMGKRKKNRQKTIGLDNVENGTGQTPQREQGNDQGNYEGNENEVEERVPLPDLDLFEDTLLPLPIQVEAVDEEKDKTGIQESARSHSESGKAISFQLKIDLIFE